MCEERARVESAMHGRSAVGVLCIVALRQIGSGLHEAALATGSRSHPHMSAPQRHSPQLPDAFLAPLSQRAAHAPT